jgi:hypothetical protein
MKFLISAFALLLIIIGCEFQSGPFEPEKQFLTQEELIELDGLNVEQSEHVSMEQYELTHPEEFVTVKATSRMNSSGKWVIEGSVKNSSHAANFKNVQLTVSFYSATNDLLGSENHTINEELSPGDLSGFYFKTATELAAHSVRIEVNRVLFASN